MQTAGNEGGVVQPRAMPHHSYTLKRKFTKIIVYTCVCVCVRACRPGQMDGMWFYLGLLVRNLVVFGVVLWSDVLPLTGCSTNLSGGAKAAMFLFHQLACPFLILIVYYQLCSWLRDRREILQRLHGLAKARLARSKQLTLSLVPDFASESLHRVPPILWHRVAALHYEQCTLIQMDIVGFSGIVSRLNVKELVDVLNSLFSAIDFAAKCIGKVWKVETIGDCYIAVIGGPQEHILKSTLGSALI